MIGNRLTMRKNLKIIVLLVLTMTKMTVGDMFSNTLTREDPCVSLCEKTPVTFTDSMYVKSCCQRGCRFFNLVDLQYGLQPNSLNGTRDACEASCKEAYTESPDRYVCGTGCDFMAKQRVSDLLSLFSITICMEEGIDSNILLTSADIPENDILTDPGLRKELLPRWWDSNGFKLPQTYVKTVPMDAGTVDYGLSSDYSADAEQTVSMPGSNWLHCASKHIGIPYWLFTSVIAVFVILSMLWLCLLTGNHISHKDVCIDKVTSPKIALYIPDELPLHKEPPPKYTQSSDCEI